MRLILLELRACLFGTSERETDIHHRSGGEASESLSLLSTPPPETSSFQLPPHYLTISVNDGFRRGISSREISSGFSILQSSLLFNILQPITFLERRTLLQPTPPLIPSPKPHKYHRRLFCIYVSLPRPRTSLYGGIYGSTSEHLSAWCEHTS